MGRECERGEGVGGATNNARAEGRGGQRVELTTLEAAYEAMDVAAGLPRRALPIMYAWILALAWR